jgi:hypothetical protein
LSCWVYGFNFFRFTLQNFFLCEEQNIPEGRDQFLLPPANFMLSWLVAEKRSRMAAGSRLPAIVINLQWICLHVSPQPVTGPSAIPSGTTFVQLDEAMGKKLEQKKESFYHTVSKAHLWAEIECRPWFLHS